MKEYATKYLLPYFVLAIESLTTINILLFFAFWIVFSALYFKWKNRNLPPGPPGLPIVGYYPFLGDKPHLTFEKLAQRYGPVFSFTIPGHTVICLGNYEAIKEAFVRQANVFSGKPQVFSILRWFMESSGLTTAEGEMFTEQRRFLLHTLRNFGFGRLSLEGRVHEVARKMLNTLESTKEEPYDIGPLIHNSTANVISSLLFDKLYELDDPEFIQQRKDVDVFFKYSPGIEAFRPWFLMKFLPWALLPQYKELVNSKKRLYDCINAIIKQHEDTFDPDNLRNYVDVHLNRLKNAKKGSKEEKYFRLVDLQSIALNMFVGGTDTSASFIYWGLKLLSLHSDVQKRVQKELDEVVGRERLPSMTDSHRLPYTEAVLMEITRFASAVTLTGFHSTTEETILFGYKIPKRSLVIANLYAAHRDPKYWSEPNSFNPEHFLDTEGTLKKKESYVPFSLGKRYCPGDSIAKMDMFLFVTAILQKFELKLAKGVDPSMNAFTGITGSLNPYKISFIPRIK